MIHVSDEHMLGRRVNIMVPMLRPTLSAKTQDWRDFYNSMQMLGLFDSPGHSGN